MSQQYEIINEGMTAIYNKSTWGSHSQIFFACSSPDFDVMPHFKIDMRFYEDRKKSEVLQISLVDCDSYSTKMNGYLLGHFHFPIRSHLIDKLRKLAERLNGIRLEDSDIPSQKWEAFCSKVEIWFNSKIRHILEKEEEMHRIFFEIQ